MSPIFHHNSTSLSLYHHSSLIITSIPVTVSFKRPNGILLDSDDFVFSNCYQVNSFTLSPSAACCVRLSPSPTQSLCNIMFPPAIIHMAIQYAVAFVNNAVAIKSFAVFNYTSSGCLLFLRLLPF